MRDIKRLTGMGIVEKSILSLAVIILVFSITSCSSEKEEVVEEPINEPMVTEELSAEAITPEVEEGALEEVETDNEEEKILIGNNDASVVMMEQEFFDMIEENPIDKEMQWEDCGSINRISLACKYRDAWILEIENSLATLKEYLTEEDHLLLEESYEGWKQYMENNTSLEQQLFYVGTSYTQESTGLSIGDGTSYPHVMEITAERTKHYAIQLKSLEYALTGTIEFAYKKTNAYLFPAFLEGRIEALKANNNKMYYITELLEDSEGKYLYCDIDADGEDELHVRTHKFYFIIKEVEGTLEVVYEGSAYKYPIKQNDLLGILYYRPGGAPNNEIYQYHAFDSQGEVQEIITFEWYDPNENGLRDEEDLYLLNGEEVSRQEWEEETKVYREIDIELLEWSDWSAS